MTSFAEVTRQVHLINDLFLSDMICGNTDHSEKSLEFSKHILATKYWFSRISWANKKRFVLALLKDVHSIWTLSLLLKSIWNSRPKDAVMSVCEPRMWSSYDQVPMDHDRTALPLSTLAEVMMSDRRWFQTLEPDRQALVLSELLTVAGGPIIWEVLSRAKHVYEQHIEHQLEELQECVVVNETPVDKKPVVVETTPVKKDQSMPRRKSTTPITENDLGKQGAIPGQAQKELENNLALWASTVKAMKDSMKLEELEMIYKNGTAKKVWKVNRSKPEIVETVDFLQLLPSVISKRILMYLPVTQLGDCARVNKYWAYIVDEIRAEMLARQKIDVELEKLRENVLRHDISLDLLSKSEFTTMTTLDTSSSGIAKTKERLSVLASNKSCAYSLWTVMNKQANKRRVATKPIRNMADFNERLEIRGAADENIWKWCKNVLKISDNYEQKQVPVERDGLLSLATATFPCPMLSKSVALPLCFPLVVDPTHNVPIKSTKNVPYPDEAKIPNQDSDKRFTLWSKDFSSLYPVCKISSHLSPF